MSTEVILNVMSALNSTGNHLSPNKNIEDETKQIHHILLYGILTNSRTILIVTYTSIFEPTLIQFHFIITYD